MSAHSQATERRKRPRTARPTRQQVRISLPERPGHARMIYASLVDISEYGVGVESPMPLAIGSFVAVSGTVTIAGATHEIQGRARVAYLNLKDGGAYRVGLSFEDHLGFRTPFSEDAKDLGGPPASDNFVDYYEVMQLSANADADTIHRVYRMLAQRYHPDNQETGDEETFKLLLRAYRVLSDPERRAQYDLEYRSTKKLRWKIFDQPKAAVGMEAEKRKRHGVLSVLYTKRLHQPDQPAVTMLELEELLACPREHLEFTLWYLKENAWIARSDNARFVITAKGVDQIESVGLMITREDRLLTHSEHPAPSPNGGTTWRPGETVQTN